MSTQQPVWVCLKCGKRYGQSPMPEFVTFHNGDCGCCWESAPVTWAAEFGYLRPEWIKHKEISLTEHQAANPHHDCKESV